MDKTRATSLWWDLPVAFVLLTRLPLPALPDHAFGAGARSVWAYPLVGAGLGAVLALLGTGLGAVGVPGPMVAGLLLVAGVCLTGAMHEDGLADMADGLWGGQTRDRRLEIMKDSRIGAYGVIALILALGLRWFGYAQVDLLALVVVLSLSRAVMPVLMYALPPARATGLSHSVGRPPWWPVALGFALSTGLAIAVLGPPGLGMLVAALGSVALVGALARAKIGGQTGDILGAAQVIAEITLLVVLTTL